MFSVKIFKSEFSPDLYVLRSHESKSVVFGNRSRLTSICLCVCVSVRLYDEYLTLYTSKINKHKSIKLYTMYQIRVKIILPGFDENQKFRSGVEQTGNQIGSEFLNNGSNNFLQNRCINTLLHVFQNV